MFVNLGFSPWRYQTVKNSVRTAELDDFADVYLFGRSFPHLLQPRPTWKWGPLIFFSSSSSSLALVRIHPYVSNDGFLDHRHREDGEGKIVVKKRNSDQKSVFNMNYFKIESPKSSGNPRVLHNHLVPVPFQLEPPSVYKAKDDADDIDQLFKGISKVQIDFTLVPPPSIPKKILLILLDLLRLNNNEFVDLKMDSPRSCSRGISPTFDAGAFTFEDKIGEPIENKNSPRKTSGRKDQVFWEDDYGHWEDNSEGLNLWKGSLTGIGAICYYKIIK